MSLVPVQPSPRILVADDDLVSRLAMEEVLRQCGDPGIVLVDDGAAAWQAMTGPAFFDLICLDVRMPPPDGLELVARLRAAPALRRVPTMLITSTADRSTVLSATRADLQGFIVKPVGAETVLRIERVLAQLDATVLEPAAGAVARLRVDTARHSRYVAAFAQQVETLAGLARELASPAAGAAVRAAFLHKADACRTAALTLGATRLEQLVSDAIALLGADPPGAARALGQADYWLARVIAARRV